MANWFSDIDQFFRRSQRTNKILKPALSFLFTSVILSPFVNVLILISYTLYFDVHIVDVVKAANEVYIYMNLVAFYLVLILLLFILTPALGLFPCSYDFVSSPVLLGAKSSTAMRVRNAYLIYRPFPNKYAPNFFIRLVQYNLSLGSIILYSIVAYIVFNIKDTEYKTYSNMILIAYVIWISICFYVIYLLYRHWQKRTACINKIKQRKKYIHPRNYTTFSIFTNIISLLWIIVAYVLLVKSITITGLLTVFILVASPVIIATYYNLIIGELGTNLLRIAALSAFVIFFVVLIWPGTERLSGGVFKALRIGGEIPVEVALTPNHNLGILNKDAFTDEPLDQSTEKNTNNEQTQSFGRIYESTVGPFYLLLYGNEKIYLRSISDHHCISDHQNKLAEKSYCQRVFSIPRKYIVSVDMMKKVVVHANARQGDSR